MYHFEAGCEEKVIPPSLLKLISTLLEGSDSQVTRGVLTVSQVALYNFRSRMVPKERCDESQRRHVYKNPLMTYISLLLYTKYRCKGLLDDLDNKGICYGYKTVLRISKSLGNAEVSRYLKQGLVCPFKLKIGLPTTFAVDNIDQSTSSMTAKTSLHGCAISATQHRLSCCQRARTSRDQKQFINTTWQSSYCLHLSTRRSHEGQDPN